jgi:hypothetical protein
MRSGSYMKERWSNVGGKVTEEDDDETKLQHNSNRSRVGERIVFIAQIYARPMSVAKLGIDRGRERERKKPKANRIWQHNNGEQHRKDREKESETNKRFEDDAAERKRIPCCFAGNSGCILCTGSEKSKKLWERKERQEKLYNIDCDPFVVFNELTFRF